MGPHRLAIALWLSPARASPALTQRTIVAVLPSGAAQLELACHAAGLECIHGHEAGGHDPAMSLGGEYTGGFVVILFLIVCFCLRL